MIFITSIDSATQLNLALVLNSELTTNQKLDSPLCGHTVFFYLKK